MKIPFQVLNSEATVAASSTYGCMGAIPSGTDSGRVGTHTLTGDGLTSGRVAFATFHLL